MKLRNVRKAKESGYPTYCNYLRDHKKELGIIAAGVGLLLSPGCNEKAPSNTRAVGGILKPPITIPVDKGAQIDGEMIAPTPPKPQAVPVLPGKPVSPKSPQIKGKMLAPKPITQHPIKSKGKIAAPVPQKKILINGKQEDSEVRENIKDKMSVPNMLVIKSKGVVGSAQPPKKKKGEMPAPKPVEEKK